jgi:hypothetical protein
VTVGHHKWLTAPPKSLIIHGAVCGKTGTSGYYLHGNFYNPQKFGGEASFGYRPRLRWGVGQKEPRFPERHEKRRT